jgi:hypothetical protein
VALSDPGGEGQTERAPTPSVALTPATAVLRMCSGVTSRTIEIATGT